MLKTKFEYKVINEHELSEITLNSMGSHGWELLTISPKKDGSNLFYFKKSYNVVDKNKRYHPEMQTI
jgi:hypothetical protein